LEYAERAVRGVEADLEKLKLSELKTEDLERVSSLAAYWDTLGWVHFRMNSLVQAEKYLKASWILSQDATVADHLGQLYEKQARKEPAVHMYKLALAAYSSSNQNALTDQTKKRLTRLGIALPKPIYGSYPGGDELSNMRTIKLARLNPKSCVADFFMVIGPGSKVEEVKFISGSEELKSATKTLNTLAVDQPFPDDRAARVVRRATVGCYSVTGCSLVLLPPDLVRSIN
jgi:hypothetical protein